MNSKRDQEKANQSVQTNAPTSNASTSTKGKCKRKFRKYCCCCCSSKKKKSAEEEDKSEDKRKKVKKTRRGEGSEKSRKSKKSRPKRSRKERALDKEKETLEIKQNDQEIQVNVQEEERRSRNSRERRESEREKLEVDRTIKLEKEDSRTLLHEVRIRKEFEEPRREKLIKVEKTESTRMIPEKEFKKEIRRREKAKKEEKDRKEREDRKSKFGRVFKKESDWDEYVVTDKMIRQERDRSVPEDDRDKKIKIHYREKINPDVSYRPRSKGRKLFSSTDSIDEDCRYDEREISVLVQSPICPKKHSVISDESKYHEATSTSTFILCTFADKETQVNASKPCSAFCAQNLKIDQERWKHFVENQSRERLSETIRHRDHSEFNGSEKGTWQSIRRSSKESWKKLQTQFSSGRKLSKEEDNCSYCECQTVKKKCHLGNCTSERCRQHLENVNKKTKDKMEKIKEVEEPLQKNQCSCTLNSLSEL